MWGTKIPGIILNSVRFALEQSIKNNAYLISVWTELKLLGYCSDKSPITITKPNGLSNIRFYLFTFTSLFWIFEGFYTFVNGHYIKSVPVWIELYFSPITIAHWFMQDGSRQAGQGVYFATNSFTYEDTTRLANLLTSKYGLKTSVIKTGYENQWRISIWKESMPRFAALIIPYMHPSMLYKLEGYV
ncbi:probable intron-encoded LAGLIDADG endonuclease (mitochondrion) [Serendipita indica DSM 11827]|uniref:Probable intron-encoded LAGLIDADG endonuclease n=1 Tax=Serendipita indica (strain DSM 11827) TaxID=1109443 RepID=G4U3E8_SERID|nr:probable intron-encoded LAGLIDADG endonuclease [Serendipita indica DSM 11827]